MNPDPKPSPRGPHAPAVRVLVADDHAVMRDGLRLLLDEDRGMTVVGEAADGREAVRLARELRPDVAVVDIAMPVLNGIEATERIRETTPETLVVVLSMHASPEYVHRALRAGARGYVLKEAAGSEVVAAVRAAHAGRRFLSAKIEKTIVDRYLLGNDAEGPLERLTARERQVLQLVVEGMSSKEIGSILRISPKTVDSYRSRTRHKLGVSDLANLVKLCIRHGLTTAE